MAFEVLCHHYVQKLCIDNKLAYVIAYGVIFFRSVECNPAYTIITILDKHILPRSHLKATSIFLQYQPAMQNIVLHNTFILT